MPERTCFDLTPDLNLRRVDLCAVSGDLAMPDCPRVTTGWFIPGKSPITSCDIHRKVWIDNLTGKRLAGVPRDPSSSHQAVFEFWPTDFARLFRSAGFAREMLPRLATEIALQGEDAATGPRILSPKSDRVYQVRLSGDDGGVLDLEAAADGAHDRLFWFVDSAYVGTSMGSAPLSWKPLTGSHLIRAVDDAGRADSRTITVSSVE
jgi:penicillin-binding protein 1C